ncbi:MAG: hypothetical protein US74_C0023G0038 [Parcubacteria group bacterium GW2011_GWA2_38_13]|nr:MAG: hypothetical protein US74_C0023G0038 [Parcubacteria group bacterium GW2011_GWA2_38_13]
MGFSLSIISTIAYFDIFDYPLTAWEIWKYLYGVRAQYIDIVNKLDDLASEGGIETRNGFYFLPKRNAIVNVRLERYLIAEKKYKKAKRILKIISCMPFIRSICIMNTLSYDNASATSDIDIMLMVEPKKLWLARFFCVSFLRIFNLRPNEEKRADTICLNFIVGTDGLDFSEIALKPEDAHFAHIVSRAVPVYDEKNYYNDFFLKNKWIFGIFPNTFPMDVSSRRKIRIYTLGRFLKKIAELVLFVFSKNILDLWAKKIQMKIMPEALRGSANKNTNVVFSSTILKFHVKDRREEYNRRWKENLKFLT